MADDRHVFTDRCDPLVPDGSFVQKFYDQIICDMRCIQLQKFADQTVAGAFIALDLEKGDHVIEFKYFPRGLKSGLIFTFAGWLVFALLMNAKTIKEKRGSKKGKPEDEDRTDDEAAIE